MKMLNRWAAVLILMTAVLLPTMSIGAATGEDGHREIVRLREIVRGLVSELALAKSLDTDDVANLRDDLAQVYRDLDALADHLGYAGQDSPQPDNGWRPYTAADIRSRPSDAEFNGWNKNADVDLNWGEYGEIIVVVANIDYQAECLIHRAYTGNVQASLRTETTGSVIIKVQDELGTHEFRIDNGGLGPVHVRGRDDLLPAAPAQPAAPAVSVAAGTTTWYSGYYELVETGQLGESPAMEWLIDQFRLGDYESHDLEQLGDRLAGLGARPTEFSLGLLQYDRQSEAMELEIPDPRFNPAGFVQLINKLYSLIEAGVAYRLEQ